jgi:hypothetical protein
MLAAYGAYIVAGSAMAFAACSAMTLFWFVRHLDPPPLDSARGAPNSGKAQAA